MDIKPIYSPEAEKAVIGSVMMNPEMYQEATKHITKDDFYNVRHQMIWSAFENLHRTHMPLDIVSLADHLGDKLQEIGGLSYLTEIATSVPSSVNAEFYAKIVLDKAKRRQAVLVASKLANFANSDGDNLDAFIPKIMHEIMNLTSSEGHTNRLGKYLSELYDDIAERMAQPKQVYGIPTGIGKLDEIIGGLQRGEVFILSGEPGLGKSLLSIQIGFSMAKSGFPGIIYEMEMSGKQTMRRALSNESNVTVKSMKTGYINQEGFTSIVDAVARMEALPIFFSDSTSWTTSAMRADITRLKQLYGIEWVIVDYLRLLKDRDGKDEHERLAHVGLALHDIAKDLNVAMLVIHSMNKSGISGTPGMESLSGSAQVSFDADTIAFLTKDDSRQNRDKNIVNLTFDKQREGDSSRVISLMRRPGFPAFHEVIKEEPAVKYPYND